MRISLIAVLLLAISGPALSIKFPDTTECSFVYRLRLELYASARNAIGATGKLQNGRPAGRLTVTCHKHKISCDVVSNYGGKPVGFDSTSSTNGLDISLARNSSRDIGEFNLAAAQLRGLALAGYCGMKIIDHGSSAKITFSEKFGGGHEIFNFFDSGKVVSWMHRDKHYPKMTLNFEESGKTPL